MSREVFKVVFAEPSGRLTSSTVRMTRPDLRPTEQAAAILRRFQRVYRTTQGNRTHVSGNCLAFDTLENAMLFASTQANSMVVCGFDAPAFEVWKATAQISTHCDCVARGLWDLPAFARHKGVQDGWESVEAPRGTVMCRDLIITEKVWPKEGE